MFAWCSSCSLMLSWISSSASALSGSVMGPCKSNGIWPASTDGNHNIAMVERVEGGLIDVLLNAVIDILLNAAIY